MEEWVLLFDLLYSYLKQCHKTWEVLQKLKGRPNYPECRHQFVDVIAPALHRYAVHFRRLALKQQERDGQSFILRRWLSETSSKLEEYQVPINKLSLVEVKSGVNLLLRHPNRLSSVQNSAQEILYDRTLLSRSAKRVNFDAVSVADLPELVPDLPLAVVACEPEVLQDGGEIMFEPFYFQM